MFRANVQGLVYMQPNLKKGHRLELSICFYSNCIELVVQKPSQSFFKLIIAITFLNYSCVVWDRKAKFAEEFAVLVTLQSTAMDWARNVRLTNSSEVDPNVTSSQEVSDIVSSANAFPKGNSATGYELTIQRQKNIQRSDQKQQFYAELTIEAFFS